jgi:hypothetical protein
MHPTFYFRSQTPFDYNNETRYNIYQLKLHTEDNTFSYKTTHMNHGTAYSPDDFSSPCQTWEEKIAWCVFKGTWKLDTEQEHSIILTPTSKGAYHYWYHYLCSSDLEPIHVNIRFDGRIPSHVNAQGDNDEEYPSFYTAEQFAEKSVQLGQVLSNRNILQFLMVRMNEWETSEEIKEITEYNQQLYWLFHPADLPKKLFMQRDMYDLQVIAQDS